MLLLLSCLLALGWSSKPTVECQSKRLHSKLALHKGEAEATPGEASDRSMLDSKSMQQQLDSSGLEAIRVHRHMSMSLPSISKNLTLEQLLFSYDARSWFNVAEYMAYMQTSQQCNTAQYLIVDDIATISGMGWSMLTMAPLALQAMVSQRVLVHASSIIQGVTWSWCNEPPFAPECYFRSWTPCIGWLRQQQLTIQDLQAMPGWDQFDSYSNGTQYIAFRHVHQVQALLEPHTRDAPFYWAEQWFASPNLRSSRFYWYGLFMQQYFSPSLDMDLQAIEFLSSNNLSYGDRFIVANVRHGSKGTEQAPIPPERFINPLRAMMTCLNTSHVFLVTETAAAAQRMSELAAANGMHLFTVPYKYPNVDSWNKHINPNATVDMTEIGRVSALVLAITRRGSGFIGTLQSAW
jgi:hypothetical protein